jgi:adenylylsulfate kinase
MIVWLIGLSGAGKTTIAKRIVKELKKKHDNVVLVDGDVLREVWGDQPPHTVEGRRINAYRISHLCRFLDRQNIHAVAAVLSIFPEWQQWNRENFSTYFEVFLDVPIEVVEERDVKGLYQSAKSGEMDNVVGMDIPFVPPPNPDLILDSSGKAGSAADLTQIILNKLQKKKFNVGGKHNFPDI